MKTNELPDFTNLLRAKIYVDGLDTRFRDISPLTAIRMALENYIRESKHQRIARSSDFLQMRIDSVNSIISTLGFKIVPCDENTAC